MRSKIQEIFRIYLKKYEISLKGPALDMIRNISLCRTGHYGNITVYCNDCHDRHMMPCSCGNRHCPVCQSVKQLQWSDNRKSEALNCGYSHIIFTVPHVLNHKFLNAELKKVMLNILFSAVSKTITTLAKDKKYLGGQPGFFSTLHTWDSQMNFHPHLHVLMANCAIDKTLNVKKPKNGKYIFPVKKMSALFKKYFLNLMEQEKIAFDKGLYSAKWVVHIKKAADDKGTNVIDYLSRYVYKVAINDSRVVSFTDETVTFRYKNRKAGTMKETTISLELFVKRFALHILPKYFRKVRFYGFLSNRPKKNALMLLRRLLNSPCISKKFADLSKSEIISQIFNTRTVCKQCGSVNITFIHPFSYHKRRTV